LKLSIYGIVYNDYAFRYYILNENLSNYKLWAWVIWTSKRLSETWLNVVVS
jgi:hypothetical protein